MSALKTLELDGWTVQQLDSEEPRVSALEVAERAGMKHARQIKELMGRNQAELENHGRIDMRRTVRRISKPNGGFELREVETPMLNEAQAMNLVALMRTPRASELRVALVKVFLACRNGVLRPGTIDGTVANSARVGDDPAALERLRMAVKLVRYATGYSTQKIHGYLRKTQRVSSPFAISVQLLNHVVQALEQVERKHVALLTAKQARLLERRSKNQLSLLEIN